MLGRPSRPAGGAAEAGAAAAGGERVYYSKGSDGCHVGATLMWWERPSYGRQRRDGSSQRKGSGASRRLRCCEAAAGQVVV